MVGDEIGNWPRAHRSKKRKAETIPESIADISKEEQTRTFSGVQMPFVRWDGKYSLMLHLLRHQSEYFKQRKCR
jgi:hypothetical protein